jgi:hypothetical protein
MANLRFDGKLWSVSLLNTLVEFAALLFVVGATARLPTIWRLNRLPRPSWFLFAESAWNYSNRAIVPLIGGLWGFTLAFPAALLADDSALATAILLAALAWIVLCLTVGGVLALTGRPSGLSPPAWR